MTPPSGTGYLLRVPAEIASTIRNLHPHIKVQIRSALQTILDNPNCGKALKEELQGLRSYRVKRYRIIYRIRTQYKHLEIVAIGPKKNIYEETFRLISQDNK